MSDQEEADRIRAAGGIVWRDEARRQVLVVLRHRYQDRCLPKGKLDPGETFEDGALREVHEETGYSARIVRTAGDLHYEVEGRPKIVRFFHMIAGEQETTEVDDDEVESVQWWSLDRARVELSYRAERGLLGH